MEKNPFTFLHIISTFKKNVQNSCLYKQPFFVFFPSNLELTSCSKTFKKRKKIPNIFEYKTRIFSQKKNILDVRVVKNKRFY